MAPLVGLLAFGATTMGTTVPAGAQASEPTSAYGYNTHVSLFGGPTNERPCADVPTNTVDCKPRPSVTLPEGGSATAITDTVPSGDARYGPGIIFTSGPIDVSTQGTTGTSGSVTSTAHITHVPTEDAAGEILYAGDIKSTCTASGTGASGSATFAGPGDKFATNHEKPFTQNPAPDYATLQISNGNPDVDGDESFWQVPANPPPNTSMDGKLESVGDHFTVVFNEQIPNGDGSITVNAVHEKLLGPIAIGDAYIGHLVCNIGAVTSGGGGDTTTTVAAGGTGTDSGGTSGGTTGTGTPNMPTTGTDVWPMVFIGLELSGAGLLAVRWANRRRAWPLR